MQARKPSNETAQRLNIGKAAKLSGLSARMVRHYESLGLLTPVSRTDAGYRQYSQADIHILRFIRRSRDLGFTMPEISGMLELWRNPCRSSEEVRRAASQHLQSLNQRIVKLESMLITLQYLLDCGEGQSRPDCPCLD